MRNINVIARNSSTTGIVIRKSLAVNSVLMTPSIIKLVIRGYEVIGQPTVRFCVAIGCATIAISIRHCQIILIVFIIHSLT